MKCVILAGGKGKRIYEANKNLPKPMINICGKPLLMHIIQIYQKFNINEYIICSGYKSKVIENYFKKKINQKRLKKSKNLDIKVVNTGLNTMTGGRIKRIKKYINNDDNFLLTYGDGLANININKLINVHKKQKDIITLTAVNPVARFGVLDIKNGKVKKFKEKPKDKNNFINGGFFVLNKTIFKYIKNDQSILEDHILTHLANKNKVGYYIHKDFWYSVDNIKDKEYLNTFRNKKKLPWL